MEIKTKYNIDDDIYFLYENKIYKGRIKALHIEVCKKSTWKSYEIYSDCGDNDLQLSEIRLFETKEALVASLLQDFSNKRN